MTALVAGAGSVARRAAGLLLIALVAFPAYRLLGHAGTGYAGEATVHVAELQRELLLVGALLALFPAILASRMLTAERVRALTGAVRGWLLRPGSVVFAVAAGALCGVLTLAFSYLVLELRPNLIDSIVQLLHARFWASGQLAGPLVANEFWHIQNALVTERGWVSQYPPGHVAMLALGMRLGAVWLVGPVMAAVAVACSLLAAERWLPEERAALRLGGLFLAISPFFVALGGSYMNHVTAAAFLAVAALCAARAAMGHWAWAMGAGMAAGLAFATRPLATLAIGGAVVLGAWVARPGRAQLPRNIGLSFLGALPALLALAWYNVHFFGAPHRFGYDVALGPAMGLGFGIDPWGNSYGLREAVAWTGADLQNLSLAWLESPLPLVIVIGVFLVFARRLAAGERILAAAALLHVGANFFYWHHGIFMGPRMLYEAAPWWILLGAVAMVRLVRLVPASLPGRLAGYSPRSALVGFYAASLAGGLLLLAPQRLASYGGAWMSTMRLEVPQPPGQSLIFVHDEWMGRIAMDLAAGGMRLDHVETLLRQNPTCDVAVFAAARRTTPTRADSLLAALDLEPRAVGPAPYFAPGSRVRTTPDAPMTLACRTEAYADRFGVYDIAPLSWLGDVPGGAAAGPLFVRDMGPERNRAALQAFPGRTPWVYAAVELEGPPVLQPYHEGMLLLWPSPLGGGAQ